MGGLKKLAEEISYSVGFEGDINQDVIHVAEEVLRVHTLNEPIRKAHETMGISRLMRELRKENGYNCKRICSWCNQFQGWAKGEGVTYTICVECRDKYFPEVAEKILQKGRERLCSSNS